MLADNVLFKEMYHFVKIIVTFHFQTTRWLLKFVEKEEHIENEIKSCIVIIIVHVSTSKFYLLYTPNSYILYFLCVTKMF